MFWVFLPFRENKRKQNDKKNIWTLPENWKKMWNVRMTDMPVGVLEWSLKTLKKNGRNGDQRKNQDHPSRRNFKISKNTEKSPGGLRRQSLRLQWNTTSSSWCKKFMSKIIRIIINAHDSNINKNRKKNNCIDTSRDKLRKLNTRWPGYDKRKPLCLSVCLSVSEMRLA